MGVIRMIVRAVALFTCVTVSYVEAAVLKCLGQLRTSDQRGRWMGRWARRWLWIFGVRTRVIGKPPTKGLLVANHIGYFDILILSATVPGIFVAKREVGEWPFFGIGARLGGTLLVDRQNKLAVGEFGERMMEKLAENIVITMFPEGTSSDGSGVLPFRTPLFEPLVALRYPTSSCAVSYRIGGKDGNAEVGFYGDAELVPHLFSVFRIPAIDATVVFGEKRVREGGRKEMARELHGEVSALHASLLDGTAAD
jgi:1-acyl-sn-glycerol-3-phosphate acyltransferase